MVKKLKIVHLYPVEMNIYGDNGNALVLKKRLEWRGIEADVVGVEVGEDIPQDTDIIVSGGGQDTGQAKVETDLQERKTQIQSMANDGVVMLLICGTYQLFGHRFVTNKNTVIKGISVLDVETYGGEERLIGNIVTQSDFGNLVGYENHSGLTYLGAGSTALGRVLSGAGNNGKDLSEGAVTKNVFGTYLHGPILPKNPAFADEILARALDRKYGMDNLKSLDDSIEALAKQVASSRNR
jgi:CobQ-like glutamine amidotransferase family enzyme